MKIPGVYVEIKGDMAQLKKDMTQARQYVTEQSRGMSNAINNALSDQQVKYQTNSLVKNLNGLNNASQLTGRSFKNLGVDLKEMQRVTGLTDKQFASLQSRMLKNQAENAQQRALKSIATAAGLTNKEIKSLGRQFNLTRGQIKKVTAQLDRTEPKLRRTSQLFASLGTQIMALGSVWLGAQGLGALVRVTDEYTLIDSKLKLVTNSSEEFTSVYERLFDISQKTGSSFAENAKTYANLALALQDTDIESEELLQVFEDINKSLVVAGASVQETQSFLLQFKQALGANRLAGDEFKGMMEANSYWAGKFAKALGTDVNGLYEMKEAGLLTTQTVLDAHKKMTEGIERDWLGIEKTISRATQEWRNAWGDIISEANKGADGTRSVADAISELASTVHDNKDEIVSLFVGMVEAGKLATSAVGGIVDAVKALAIVAASDEATLFEMITGGPDVWDEWIEGSISGVMQLKDQLKAVSGQIANVEKVREFEKANDGWTNSAENNYQVLLKQKDAIEAQIESIQLLKSEQDSGGADIPFISADKSKTRLDGDNVKESADNRVAIEEKTTVKIIDFWDAVYDARESRIERELLTAEAASEKLTTILTDPWKSSEDELYDYFEKVGDEMIREHEDKTTKMGEIWADMSTAMESTFRIVVGDGLRGEFDSIGDAFESLMSNMLSSFVGTIAEMAAKWAAEGIGEMIGIGSGKEKESSGIGGVISSIPVIGPVIDGIGSIFGFADGGYHSGGWRIVGERGPELEYTGPSQIFSNSDSRAMLGGQSTYFEGGGYSGLEDALGDTISITEENKDTVSENVFSTDGNTEKIGELDATTQSNTSSTESLDTSTQTNTVSVDAMTGALGTWGGAVRDMTETVVSAAAKVASVASMGVVGVGISSSIPSVVDSAFDWAFGEDDGWDANEAGSSPSNQGMAGGGAADDDNGAGWGFAKGGVIDKVYNFRRFRPAPGDDGFVSVSKKEGIIKADTMEILDKSIRNGSLVGGDSKTSQILEKILQAINSAGGSEVHIYGKGTEAFIDKVIVKKAKSGISMSKPVYV